MPVSKMQCVYRLYICVYQIFSQNDKISLSLSKKIKIYNIFINNETSNTNSLVKVIVNNTGTQGHMNADIQKYM